MANSSAVPFTRTVSAQVGAVTVVGSALDTTVFVVPEDGVVTAVTYNTPTAVTGANTNSRTVSVINKGTAGSGTTSIASLALVSGVNIAAFVPRTITLSATPANLQVSTGDVLVFNSLPVGTGIADTGGLARLIIERR